MKADMIAAAGRLLRLIYNYLFALIILEGLYLVMTRDYAGLRTVLVTLMIFAVSYILRDIIYNVGLLFILHAALGAGTYFIIHENLSRIFLAVVLTALFSTSVSYKLNNYTLSKFTDPPYGKIIAALIITMYGAYLKDTRITDMVFILSLFVVMLFILIIYTDAIDSYLAGTRNVSGVPLRKVIAVNTIYVISAILIISGFILLLIRLGAADVGDALIRMAVFLLKIIRVIVVFLFSLISALIGRLFGGRAAEMIRSVGTEGTISMIARILDGIFIAICFALTAYLIYKLIRRLVAFVMISRAPQTDRVIDVPKENKKTAVYNRPVNIIRNVFSKEARIRRRYKKTVLKYKRLYMPDQTDTTGDIMKHVPECGGDDISEITKLYERARYGEEA